MKLRELKEELGKLPTPLLDQDVMVYDRARAVEFPILEVGYSDFDNPGAWSVTRAVIEIDWSE